MSIAFKIPIKPSELRLDYTLQCGQSFRWFEVKPKIWRGVIGSRVWTLHQDENTLYCNVTVTKENSTNFDKKDHKSSVSGLETIIKGYLRLDVSLCELYKKWSAKDKHFADIAKYFSGIRMLDQDPVENVFSFICSSNNNIERITNLVNLLCRDFGSYITRVDGEKLYSFPSVENLATYGTEEKLRHLGFGYRAKYIQNSAKMIMDRGGKSWLQELKHLDYKTCHSEIIKLPGVGPKVADCICLMSMNHLNSTPVDTHVFQIAARDYLPHLKQKKSLTPKVYEEIGDYFRSVFGSYAGWAQSVLFTADLKKFSGAEMVTKGTKKKRNYSDTE